MFRETDGIGPRQGRGSSTLLLSFSVDGCTLAVPASLVSRVVRAVAVSPLPNAPPIFDGLIDVAGVLVPVLNVRRRLGSEPSPVQPDQSFIIIAAGRRTVALRVDLIGEVLSVPDASIQPASAAGPSHGHLAGVTRGPGGLLLIHDPEAFLTSEEGDRIDTALSAWLRTS